MPKSLVELSCIYYLLIDIPAYLSQGENLRLSKHPIVTTLLLLLLGNSHAHSSGNRTADCDLCGLCHLYCLTHSDHHLIPSIQVTVSMATEVHNIITYLLSG